MPKSPIFLGKFCKGVNFLIFLVKSFLGNFYRHLAIFFLVTLVRTLKKDPIIYLKAYNCYT